MNKNSSIIDYPRSGLDSAIWDENLKLKLHLREQILNKLYNYLNKIGLKHLDEWIRKIKIIGSTTSYQWRNDSDLDVHIEVDADKFIDLEFKGSIKPEDVKNILNESGRKLLNLESIEKLFGTQHPIEYYFEIYVDGKILKDQSIVEYDGVYDLQKDEWAKPPREVTTAFDTSELYSHFINAAEDLAKDFDVKLGIIKRNILDVKFLNEALGSFKDSQSIDTYKKAISVRLAKIETEIKDYMTKARKVIDKRKKAKSQYDDENLKFKFLAKYSYIWLQKELEKILGTPPEITEEKLQDVHDAIETQWERQGYSIVKSFSLNGSNFIVTKNSTGEFKTFLL